MAPLKVGIAGLGTVGAEVVRLIEEQGRLLSARSGRGIRVVAVTARSAAVTGRRAIDTMNSTAHTTVRIRNRRDSVAHGEDDAVTSVSYRKSTCTAPAGST